MMRFADPIWESKPIFELTPINIVDMSRNDKQLRGEIWKREKL